MSLQRQVEWEARFGDGLFVATILWIVFGALPMIGLLVGQLVTGGFVKSGDVPASFPAFMPPWWAAYPMTLLLVVLGLAATFLPFVESVSVPSEFVLAGVRFAMVHDSGARVGRARRMRAWFPGADVVVYGHSHVPYDAVEDGLHLFNPGSAGDRRAGA